MQILPVLDLKSGRAVHAVAGDRDHYRPVRSLLHVGSDPLALAGAYRDRLGLRGLYLADLDAIAGGPPALDLYAELADLGLDLWVDAGLRGRDGLVPLLDAGASTLIAGSETTAGPDPLARMLALAGPGRLAFSLDLREGRAVLPELSSWPTADPLALARLALETGVRRLLVLDLARVGTGTGVGTLALLRALRAARPEVEIAIGGGVSGPSDLRSLAASGASAVLIASALHDGRIVAEDIRRVKALAPRAARLW